MDFQAQNLPEASIKSYFLDKDDKVTEIRRFVMPCPVGINNLVEKVRILFAIDSSQEVQLQWLDPECDRVSFTTDQELADALHAVASSNDATLRVYVSLPPALVPAEKYNVLHPGVMCDGCENKLRGYRFKCAICTDFDLCCHCCLVLNRHSEHPMFLIRRPRDPYMCRLSKLFQRAYWSRRFRPDTPVNASGEGSVLSDAPVGCVGGDSGEGVGGKDSGAVGLPRDCLRAVLRELQGAAERILQYQQQRQLQQQLCGFSEASMEEMPSLASTGLCGSSDDGGPPAACSQEETLRFVEGIGSSLNSLLQPLGIEVSYHATAQSPPRKQQPSKPCSAKQQVPERRCQQQQQAQSASSTDFVMVGEDASCAAVAAAATAAEAVAVAAAVAASTETAAAAASSAAVRLPPLPAHVATALEQMRNMGFSDDDGRLTELLLSANGEIGRVLDALRQS